MPEHVDVMPKAAAASLEGRPSAADGVTLKISQDAPRDARRRRNDTIALLAAVACIVLGVKLLVIAVLGSPVPLSDQWDGEAILYSRYLRGALSFAQLFAPHNEHRIVVFRMLALLHLELAGEWNTRLEMILGAIVDTAVITWFTSLLMPLVSSRRRMLLGCFVAFLFAFPIFENSLWGFQDQVYLALLFGIAALAAFASASPFSARWFCGLIAAILSYFSFATGVATILAAAVLVGLQIATNARKRCRREFAGVIVIASTGLAIILWASSSAHPLSTPWTVIEGLFLLGACVMAALLPMAWFCWHTVSKRPAISDRAWPVIGIAAWLVIQLGLLAYGRGAAIAVRYMDAIMLVYPLGLMAMFALADRARASRFSRYTRPVAMAWVFTVVVAFALLGYYGAVLGAIDWSKAAREETAKIQTYLATGNVDYLKSTGRGGHGIELSYPYPGHLAEVLGDPNVRAILPPEIRPSDADNVGARNRMLLKGSLAGATATAVRFIFSVGPALLALGVGLFFGVEAQRSFRALKGHQGWHRRPDAERTS
ncbi:hypothetical protein [Mycobacterium sp. E787]|uniref:hypothetical protein n=1 Tax=Mycobacterium sp. E787 TaxID=1834150 RepID=UPI0008016491|nr:hypothetical protein [Mycobacterium sp. E787]OBI56037.1 hypothetical protein A5705_23120 [Mycobacterium sp. E787]